MELNGTGSLIRSIVRRDRVRLLLWIAAVPLTAISTAASFKGLYPTAAELKDFATTIADNAAYRALTGRPHGDTLGAITAWRVATLNVLILGLLGVFHVGRHTRAEEESGRAELVRAAAVGRHAVPAAALMTVAAAQLLSGAITALGLISQGLPAKGAVAVGAAATAAGWAFAGVTLVAAQLVESTHAVYGVAGATIGAAYVLRAAGDSGDGTLSWLSPIGWAQAVRPYGAAGERWWVLGLSVTVAGLLVAAAFVLSARRDLGAGLVRPRPGPPRAGARLRGPVGLAIRLQRGAILGWSAGLMFGGGAIGAVAKDVGDLLDTSPELVDYINRAGGGRAIVDAYLSASFGMIGLAAAGFAISAALRLRSEETALRAEPVLATAVDRVRWAASHVVVAAGGTVVVLAAAGLGAGLIHGIRTHDVGGQVVDLVKVAVAQAPAAWVLAGLAVALFGLMPRRVVVAWGALAVILLLDQLGPALRLAQWVMDLSPFTHTRQLPSVAVQWAPVVALAAIAAGLIATGLAAFRRRDIG